MKNLIDSLKMWLLMLMSTDTLLNLNEHLAITRGLGSSLLAKASINSQEKVALIGHQPQIKSGIEKNRATMSKLLATDTSYANYAEKLKVQENKMMSALQLASKELIEADKPSYFAPDYFKNFTDITVVAMKEIASKCVIKRAVGGHCRRNDGTSRATDGVD